MNCTIADTADATFTNTSEDYASGFRSAHEGGVQFLLADGAVRFVSENIDSQPSGNPANHGVFQALSTIQGGEVIGEF